MPGFEPGTSPVDSPVLTIELWLLDTRKTLQKFPYFVLFLLSPVCRLSCSRYDSSTNNLCQWKWTEIEVVPASPTVKLVKLKVQIRQKLYVDSSNELWWPCKIHRVLEMFQVQLRKWIKWEIKMKLGGSTAVHCTGVRFCLKVVAGNLWQCTCLEPLPSQF